MENHSLTFVLLSLFVCGSTALTVVSNEACSANGRSTVTPYKRAKFGEPCTSPSDCSGAYGPTMCLNGTCKCAPNYYPKSATVNETDDVVWCFSSPGWYQSCTDECRSPYKCIENNNSVPTPAPSWDQDVVYFGKPSFVSSSRKTCQCVAPYKVYQGSCVLDCQADEIPGSDGHCHKRCGENEIQLKDFQCKPAAALGGACEADVQCSTPFSECASGQCKCRSGFKEDSGSCVPATAHCQFGEPLRPDGSGPDAAPVGCTKVQPPQEGDVPCRAGYYCQVYDSSRSGSGKSNGICCPNPKSTCPVGEPHPTANCSAGQMTIYALGAFPDFHYQSIDEVAAARCPTETHYCYYPPYINGFSTSGSCCPRECSSQMVLVNRQCLPKVPVGGKCQANEQCSSFNADCINGVCACSAKTTEYRSSSGPSTCIATCDYVSEATVNNRCYPRLKVGDQCRGQESRCPYNGYCNGAGVCQCPCGTMALEGVLCAPAPTCPDPRGSATVRYSYTTPQVTKEDYEKATFCRDPSYNSSTPIIDAAESCPDGFYCKSYISKLGLCCPKPEPYCPYNSNVYEKCDAAYFGGSGYGSSTATPGCKSGQFCHNYLNVYYGNQKHEGVCCDTYKPATRPPYYNYNSYSAPPYPPGYTGLKVPVLAPIIMSPPFVKLPPEGTHPPFQSPPFVPPPYSQPPNLEIRPLPTLQPAQIDYATAIAPIVEPANPETPNGEAAATGAPSPQETQAADDEDGQSADGADQATPSHPNVSPQRRRRRTVSPRTFNSLT